MKKNSLKNLGLLLGKVLLLLLPLCMIIPVLNYALYDDSSSYTRITMQEMYTEEENIDVLFLGSSHAYRAYDPTLYTELTGRNSFNLGSSGQNYDVSYYLLKEVLKEHKVEILYMDIYYKFLTFDPLTREIVQLNLITDYMKWSPNKIQFVGVSSELKQMPIRLLPFRREWTKVADLPYIKDVISKKQTAAYKNYEYISSETEKYMGKGFVSSTATLDASVIDFERDLGSIEADLAIDEDYNIQYLYKIIELCKGEGVELVFATAPSYEEYMEAIGPYDIAYEYVLNIAKEAGIPYLDFNMCKKEVQEFTQDYFIDIDHVNGKGATAITEMIVEIEEDQSLIDEYFAPCYDER